MGVYADDTTSHCFWVSFLGVGVNLDDHWNLVSDSFCENFKNDLIWDHCFTRNSLRHSVHGKKQLTIVSLIVLAVKKCGCISCPFSPCSFLVSFLTVFLFSFSDGILCTLKMLV